MRPLLLLGLAIPAILFFLASADGVPAAFQDKTPPAAAQPTVKPIRALLVLGGCCHDYGKQKDIITKGISALANVVWTVSYDPDKGSNHVNPVYSKNNWSKGFDIVVHDECLADIDAIPIVNHILEPHRQGLPAVVLHCAMHSYRTEGWNKKGAKPTPWFEFTGLASTGHGPQKPIDLTFVDKDGPITKGMENWITINEELYNNFSGNLLDTAKPLTRGKQGQADSVVAWTNVYNQKAKVFSTTLGHNNATVADDRYLELVTRGLLWATNHLTEDGKPAPGYGRAK